MFQFGIFTVLFGIVAYTSAGSFWTESEVWPATVVKYLFTSNNAYDFQVKPLTDLLLYGCFLIAHFLDIHPMDVARAAFALNFLLLIYLCYRLVRRHSPAPLWTGFVMLLFLTDSYLIKRGSQVRTDLLMTTVLAAWMWLEDSVRARAWTLPRRLSAFVAAALIAALFTPKSLLFTFALFILSFTAGRSRQGLLTLIALPAVALSLHPRLADHVPPLRFFLLSFSGGPGMYEYFDLHRFMYVKRFVLENPLFPVIWARHLWVGFKERDARDLPARLRLDFANVTFAIFLLYPDRLPFFIASLIPFWLIPLADLPRDRWVQKALTLIRPSFRRMAAVAVVGLLVASGIFWTQWILLHHNAKAHHAFVAWIRQFEPRLEHLNVYDPAGVIPFLPVDHWFLGPGEARNKDVIERIQKHPPDLILYTSRVGLIEREISTLLRAKYWWDGAGILVRRQIVTLPPATRFKGQEFLQHLEPFVRDKNGAPLEEFDLEFYTEDGVDFSRHVQWLDEQGTHPFDTHVHTGDFAADLQLPPGVTYAVIYPLKIQTPYSHDWPELFRFDVEN